MTEKKRLSAMSDTEIEDQIVEGMRDYFLQFTDAVVKKYKNQIESTVRWYVKNLPRHIATSETDDLSSEAKLAFIDCLKNWDPRKGELWPYASLRVKGALQDYLRKRGGDPVTGVYEFITQAAYVYLAFNRDSMHHDKVDDTVQLKDAMKNLSENEQKVLKKYYEDDKTFKQIGDDLKLSESQVSRICKTAAKKMKKYVTK